MGSGWFPVDSGGWTQTAKCKGAKANADLRGAKPIAGSFGLGLRNNRAQTAAQTGLRTADMKTLELAWVVALRRLSEDDALAERLRAGARRWVEENYDAHRNTARLVECFEKAMR